MERSKTGAIGLGLPKQGNKPVEMEIYANGNRLRR